MSVITLSLTESNDEWLAQLEEEAIAQSEMEVAEAMIQVSHQRQYVETVSGEERVEAESILEQMEDELRKLQQR